MSAYAEFLHMAHVRAEADLDRLWMGFVCVGAHGKDRRYDKGEILVVIRHVSEGEVV